MVAEKVRENANDVDGNYNTQIPLYRTLEHHILASVSALARSIANEGTRKILNFFFIVVCLESQGKCSTTQIQSENAKQIEKASHNENVSRVL